MNCSVCAGTLKIKNGLYICSNCGNRQQISAFFENTDVFICYIENDEQGRRTKDSVIANDLYTKLQAVNVNTFYQRISSSELTGEYYQKACEEAFDKAKIILITGTSKDIFEILMNDNAEKLSSKTIIPVYSDMNAYDLPQQLVNLQAVNYDNIAAFSDLTKNILHILGRDSEIDTLTLVLERAEKKKFRIAAGITLTALLIVGIVLYFIFGTPYVLKSKKYEYAEKLSQNGNYIEAIKMCSSLGDYRNSANMLKSLYDKYDGYFNNDDKTLCLYLNTDDNLKSEIEVIKIIDGKTIRLNTSTVMNGNKFPFEFTDSQKNTGNGKIELLNDGIKLSVSTDTKSEPSIGNIDYLFEFENRTDAPISSPITKEDLLSWITTKTTESDLIQMGFELELSETVSTVAAYYKIKGTDIEVVLFNDISQTMQMDDALVFCISAPAKLLASDKIGLESYLFLEKNICYIPDSKLVSIGHPEFSEVGINFGTAIGDNLKIVNKDTIVSIVSDKIGDFYWEQILSDVIKSEASKKYGSEIANYSIGRPFDNTDNYLYYINFTDFTVAYRVNKQTYHIEFEREIPVYHTDYLSLPVWAAAPELVEEFDIPINETNAKYLPMVSGLSGNIVPNSSDYLFNSDT